MTSIGLPVFDIAVACASGLLGTLARNPSAAVGAGSRAATGTSPALWDHGSRYQDSFPWQELVQLRLVAFQPMLLSARFLTPLLCVAAFTVVEL